MSTVKMDAYREAMLEDLAKLVAVPSVCSSAESGMPFGSKSAQALNMILKRAEEMGFAVKNIGNYAGHAEYGEGSEIAAVVTHVDVVPAGNGWHTEPFTLTQKGNLYYGRGTADDKGAAVTALYALKALKDAGVAGKRRLRVIFGAGEEIASDDLKQYFLQEPLPVMGFTPDSEYGICNREKGILRIKISAGANDSKAVREFTAGTVVNAVPDSAAAQICCTNEQYDKLKTAAEKEGGFTIEKTSGGVKITSAGKAVHAMKPQDGINAASRLIVLLDSVFTEEKLGGFLHFISQRIGIETNGFSIGAAQSDKESGELTLNVGLVRINAGEAWVGLDIRYPVTGSGEKVFSNIKAFTDKAGLNAEIQLNNKPLFLPGSSGLISLLKDSYASVMGEPAQLYSTGGGTYARELQGRGVAFGLLFPEEPDRRLHNSDEHIDITYYMRHTQICMEAMYRMFTA